MQSENELMEKEKAVFAKNLNMLLEESHVSHKQLADAIGQSRTTVSAWCRAEAYPKWENICMVADYFHVSRYDLVGIRNEERKELVLTRDEISLIKAYRALDTFHRETLQIVLQRETKRIEKV